MRSKLFSIVISISLLLSLFTPSVAKAQTDTPPEEAVDLKLSTEYPALVMGVEEIITLDLELETETQAQIVEFDLQGLAEGWNASFRGGGRTVRSIYVEPGERALVDLRIEPPVGVEAGTYPLMVVAESEVASARLPIELIVEEKAPASLAFEVELPTLRGNPSTTFRYNVTVRNEGDEDLTVDLFAQAPPVFRVTIQSGTQEVTSIPLEANSSKRLTVEAEPLLNIIPADRYPITLRAQGGDITSATELTAEIVGQSSLSLTTPDGRLSGRAEAGERTTFTLLVQNTGSAAAQRIEMSATQPSGWTVDFEPQSIDEVEPGGQREVTAIVEPAEKALAGDYMVTFRARPENESSESIEYRVTVRTSTIWGLVGVGLIAIAVAVVGWAVTRFGRR